MDLEPTSTQPAAEPSHRAADHSEDTVNTNTLAAAVAGFLLGGLTVSVAAELENDNEVAPAHSSRHQE